MDATLGRLNIEGTWKQHLPGPRVIGRVVTLHRIPRRAAIGAAHGIDELVQDGNADTLMICV